MKRNIYAERKTARKLPKELQQDVMFEAKKHLDQARHYKNANWTVPENHSLLMNRTNNELIGINRIWYDIVVLSSQQKEEYERTI